jgi:hypothetical protein
LWLIHRGPVDSIAIWAQLAAGSIAEVTPPVRERVTLTVRCRRLSAMFDIAT